MTTNPTARITALLASTTLSPPNHAEILALTQPPASQKPKNSRPQNLETLHTHVVALLKLDRDEDALRILETEGGEALRERAGLEFAYALYKCGRLEEARMVAGRVADGVGEEGKERGAKHVEAQASYRSENFARAAEIYKELWDGKNATTGNGDEESDLRINSGATDSQLEWKGQGWLGRRKQGREDLEAFETAYNAACVAIAKRELAKGEVLLRTAKGLCASLDELTEAEKTAEILPIQVQQLYVLVRLGKIADAEKLAAEIRVEDIPDASTRQIAQQNLLATTISATTTQTPLSNPYLSHRLISDPPPLPKTDTLFTHQSNLIALNALTLALSAHKPNAVEAATTRTLTYSPPPSLSPYPNHLSTLNAAAHTPNPHPSSALKILLPTLPERPTDIGLALTVIQLHHLTSNHRAATYILETLQHNLSNSATTNPKHLEIRHSPSLTALAVSVYKAHSRHDDATAALATSAAYWLHQPSKAQTADPATTALLRAAALALLTSPFNPIHKITALEIFSHLRTANPDDKFAQLGYIAASNPSLLSPSPTDHTPPPSSSSAPNTNTDSATASLPPLSQTLKNHNLDPLALEAAGIPPYPEPVHSLLADSEGVKKRKPNPLVQPPEKKKRVRLSKRPKDFVEGKVPDPERWLPLRERSGFRVKGKKGKRKDGGGMGTQGGVEKEKEKVAPVPAAAVTAGGGGAGAGGGGKGKSKKKGKK